MTATAAKCAKSVVTYLALGSNLGDRASNLNLALRELRAKVGKLEATSCLYQTAPQYVEDQPEFLNAACRISTTLPPERLLQTLKDIEKELGRRAGIRFGPRPIDLDVLFYGSSVLTVETTCGPLYVPHLRMAERTFVLRPLCDIAGDVEHPILGRTVRELYKDLLLSMGGGSPSRYKHRSWSLSSSDSTESGSSIHSDDDLECSGSSAEVRSRRTGAETYKSYTIGDCTGTHDDSDEASRKAHTASTLPHRRRRRRQWAVDQGDEVLVETERTLKPKVRWPRLFDDASAEYGGASGHFEQLKDTLHEAGEAQEGKAGHGREARPLQPEDEEDVEEDECLVWQCGRKASSEAPLLSLLSQEPRQTGEREDAFAAWQLAYKRAQEEVAGIQTEEKHEQSSVKGGDSDESLVEDGGESFPSKLISANAHSSASANKNSNLFEGVVDETSGEYVAGVRDNLTREKTLNGIAEIKKQQQEAEDNNEVEDEVYLPYRILPLSKKHCLPLGERTLVMGILNVTPDSFSDGGQYNTVQAACERARQMELEGCDIIDIGGESTRPGAVEVEVDEEIARVVPVIQGIRQASCIPISIDTRKASVARAAVQAGANIINDVSGGTFDKCMLDFAAKSNVPIILMHSRGSPQSMITKKVYRHVAVDVMLELKERVEQAVAAGIPRWNIILDPGVGFAKGQDENIALLKNMKKFVRFGEGCATMVGTSRKAFIGKICEDNSLEALDWGTAATCAKLVDSGVNILRVHDVKNMVKVVRMADAVKTVEE